ncbi:MAG: hypothetical protein F4Y22_13335 [Gammaproteobacteria bacterium]|nr:hypothetical protein [Gammaproteobacteria bacterium]
MTRSLSVLVLFAAAANAAAQTASQQELEACAAIERAIERLDCFESLTARGAAPVPAEVEPGQAAEAPPEHTSTSQDRLENVGVEQLPDNRREEGTRERDDIGAIVTEVSEGPRGNLLFHLENGQVWRQIEARYVPLPADAPFPVQISRGLFGEYRLRVDGEGRLVRIRRVQ